ncbi:hypothetical protein ACFL27_09595 [candidate division CSSED10-310 bacterium]|uniref:DUF4864 domain-containing protein n=1 Tax=candidate division CSSED10-310 bacterium TaxID=2855610 RepID=A0ABV6YW40_UNCC1
MFTKKGFIITCSILALIWIGVYIYITVDFETLLDRPEEVVLRFQGALKGFDFDKAWSKLSVRMKSEVFGDKTTFSRWIFTQPKIRRDIAFSNIINLTSKDSRTVKIFLKSRYYGDYAILMLIKERKGGWKIDDIQTNLNI